MKTSLKNNISKAHWALWKFVALASFASTLFGRPLTPVNLVDKPATSPEGGGGDSLNSILTSDGRYVLFASSANDLVLINSSNPVPPQVPPPLNVYRRDRLTQTTKLVSISLDGAAKGNGDSIPLGISTNGQYALFESAANNLVAGDTNNVTDVFLRDLLNNVTLLVSLSTNNGVGNGASRSAVMTPDGRTIAFVSAANNLAQNDTNGISDLFVRDMQAAITVIASAGARPGTGSPIGYFSDLPVITPQGRYVAFYSTATNLALGGATSGHVYVRDLLTGTTFWASTNAPTIMLTPNIRCYTPDISDDGRFVAFEACLLISGATTSTTNGIMLRHDLLTGLTDIVNTSGLGVPSGSEFTARNLKMTPDGRFVAFVANINGNNGTKTAVEVWDSQSNTTVVASLDLGQSVPMDSFCYQPAITPNGRFVAFLSNAPNLVTNPVVNGFHLYLRDLSANATALIDADTNGVGSIANLLSQPELIDDGSSVAFEAFDGALTANDNNRAYDVFVRNVGTSSTELISVGLPGLPSHSPNGLSMLTTSCLSTNGRYVAFTSEADNLSSNDSNGFRDAYVRDLSTGSNLLVSVNISGVAANGISSDAAISGNGRFVAFTSTATDFGFSDNNNASDVFLRDTLAGTTELVSVTGIGTAGNAASFSPSVSDDGRYVLFYSKATDLTGSPGGNSFGNIFWRDMQSGTTLSLTAFPAMASLTSLTAAMTPDGNRVIFGFGSNTIARVYVWDATLNQNVYSNTYTEPFFAEVLRTSISPNGNRIIFHGEFQAKIVDLVSGAQFSITNNTLGKAASQFSADNQYVGYSASNNVIYLYNFGTSNNITVSAGIPGNSDSPTINTDGRFIAYRNAATNQVALAGDSNGIPDIYLYDRLWGRTTLVTASPYGNWPANGRSLRPVFSRDGQTLVWQSWANNLAGQDFNLWGDIFVLQSFATNSISAHGPFSIADFGFSSLAGFGASELVTTLVWPLGSGTNYVVQYKNALTDPTWQTLSGTVQLLGNQGFAIDVSPESATRFYRVLSY